MRSKNQMDELRAAHIQDLAQIHDAYTQQLAEKQKVFNELKDQSGMYILKLFGITAWCCILSFVQKYFAWIREILKVL